MTMLRFIYVVSAIITGYYIVTFDEALPHLVVFLFAGWVGGFTWQMVWSDLNDKEK